MAVYFNRNTGDQYFTSPPINYLGGDMCLVLVVNPEAIGSNHHYIISTGEVSTANTWNIYIQSTRIITSTLYGTSVQNRIDSPADIAVWGQWQVIVAQVRNNTHEIWHCPLDGVATRHNNADVTGIGPITFGGMDIGRRKVSPLDRYFGGGLSAVALSLGKSLSQVEIEAIANGKPINSYIDLNRAYEFSGTPAEIATDAPDLSKNNRVATLGGGSPVYSVGPGFSSFNYKENTKTLRNLISTPTYGLTRDLVY